jgi:hypothetical protein
MTRAGAPIGVVGGLAWTPATYWAYVEKHGRTPGSPYREARRGITEQNNPERKK